MQALKDYLAITQIPMTELAARIGISKHQLSRYLSGTHEPRIATLVAMAKATSMTVDRLIEGTVWRTKRSRSRHG